jgi:hypothetical protein
MGEKFGVAINLPLLIWLKFMRGMTCLNAESNRESKAYRSAKTSTARIA